MEFKNILFEHKENYAIITINRPDKLNALNKDVFDELNAMLDKVELDRNIRALIITGSGDKAFVAGADIKELNACDEITGQRFSEYGSSILSRIEHQRIPVIAAVNGFALGGGCELALACHIRYSSDNAKFGQPEVNLGIIPGYGGTQRLTRVVGKGKSMELILTGNIIDAHKAKDYGLVNDVFSKDELLPKVEELVNLILSKSKAAVSASVEAINASEELSPLEGLAFESRKFGEVCGTEDFKEGTSAFLEKRKPNFTGK